MKTIDEVFKDKVLDFSICGVYVYDLKKGINVYINQKYTDLTGYELDSIRALSHKAFFNLFHPEDQASLRKHMSKLIESKKGETVELECRFKKADGSWMWCRYKDSVFDADRAGKPTQLIGSFIDITKEKEIELEANYLNQRLTLAIEASSLVIYETNIKDDTIKWEGGVSKLYGCTEDEVATYSKWSAFLYPEDLVALTNKLKLAVETKNNQQIVFKIKDGNKKLRYVKAAISVIFNDNGEAIKYIGINKDVTLERENDDLLSVSRKELLQLNKTITKEQEKLQYYFDTIPSIILLLDKNCNIEMVNDFACKLYGYKKDEMIGKDFFLNFIPERLIEKTTLLFQTIMDSDLGEDKKYVENWALCKDGSEKLIAWKNSLVYDEDGNIIGGISTGDDITKEARKKEQVVFLKEFAKGAIGAKDIEEVFYQALKSICGFTNWPVAHIYYPDSDNIGKLKPSKIWYVKEGHDLKSLIEVTNRTNFSIGEGLPGIVWNKQKAIWADEFKIETDFKREKEARKYDLKGAFSFPIISDGETTAVFEFFYKKSKDERVDLLSEYLEELKEQLTAVIDRDKFQQELQEALKKVNQTQKKLIQSEKMASLGILSAGIAHEINNPINFVNAGAAGIELDLIDLMKLLDLYETIDFQKKLPDAANQIEELKAEIDYKYIKENIMVAVKDIKEGGNRTSEIVKGLKRFSRGDSEEKFNVNVNEEIESNIKIIQRLSKKKILYLLELQEDINEFNGFPGQLNQLFMNLIMNAEQSIKKEGVIKVTTFNNDEGVTILISDNGCGIPEELGDRIFDPFLTTKEVGEGTGLGLSIGFSIVENHNGIITYSSKLNEGTTFEVYFPNL